MNSIGDGSPALDLCVVVNSRRARIALAVHRGLCSLGHDQPSTGALLVVVDVQLCRAILLVRTAARHRSHHHTIGALDVAEPDGVEKGRCQGHDERSELLARVFTTTSWTLRRRRAR